MTTKANVGSGFFRANCVVLLTILSFLIQPARAADTNAPSDATQSSNSEAVHSYSQIEEQLISAQLTMEKYQQEADAAATSNSLAMDERLKAMERAFANERLDQLSSIEHSTRMVLIASGAVAALGFVALALAAFMQWTAVNRLAATAANLSALNSQPVLGMSEPQLLPSHALEQSTSRFLGLIERLEQRIHELEASYKPHKALPESHPSNGGSHAHTSADARELSPSEAPSSPPPQAKAAMADLLMSKSQTLLKLGNAQAALACLDEILAMEPENALALVKKGGALERLQRFEEALQYYDRAIARDSSMTIAYL
ncbi:MAG TPA: tetratricopeptide repeat protein, partial [Verrucomicrobiae bacterium]